MSMKIHKFEFNLFGVSTYIVWDEATLATAVIDPGMSDPDECEVFSQFVERESLQITCLVNTHLHIDHTLGNEFVEDRYGVGLTAHPADEFLGQNRDSQARMFHLRGVATSPLKIAVEVKQGDFIYLGDSRLEVLEVPGHSPGSIALYSAADGFVITGDALFYGSIGRTDLPGGNHAQLVASVRSRLLTLPPSTIVYPGHGPSTTIGREIKTNPYL